MKIIHWIISIAAVAYFTVFVVGCVVGLGYALYLLVTEATIIMIVGIVAGVVYWAGLYLAKHGFAWNPKTDCEPADEVKP